MVIQRPLAVAAVLAVAIAGSAVAAASPPNSQITAACDNASAAVLDVVRNVANTQVHVITSHIHVNGPGTLTGKIGFNPTGSTLRLDAEPSAVDQGGGCAVGAIGPGVPKGRGHTWIVSTLHRTFTKAGRYTLTFKLNRKGEKILARLGAADRAYRKRHPHGSRPPSIAFGVSLTYEPGPGAA